MSLKTCKSALLLAGWQLTMRSQRRPRARKQPCGLTSKSRRPPSRLGPLWFWNGPLDKRKTTEIMERSRESGYAGFGILPMHGERNS